MRPSLGARAQQYEARRAGNVQHVQYASRRAQSRRSKSSTFGRLEEDAVVLALLAVLLVLALPLFSWGTVFAGAGI